LPAAERLLCSVLFSSKNNLPVCVSKFFRSA
jgi:hypothetical protein